MNRARHPGWLRCFLPGAGSAHLWYPSGFTGESSLGTDYHVFWQAGRFALIQHASPYSAELDRVNQVAILKHLALPGEDQFAFAYPPFALLPIFPTIWMPYVWAQSFWMALLILLLITGLVLSAPSERRWLALSLGLAYPFIFGIILGNLAIFFGCLLIFVLWGLVLSPRRTLALEILLGFLLAWTTAKPQLSWLLILLLLRNWIPPETACLFGQFRGQLRVFPGDFFRAGPRLAGRLAGRAVEICRLSQQLASFEPVLTGIPAAKPGGPVFHPLAAGCFGLYRV